MAPRRLNELQERFSRMCGLVVMLGLGGRQADAAVVSQMARSIAHRGPDDSGLYLDQQVGFGFRRLAILDLSPTGHQPMCSEDGELVIVFNGEIYNYIELREELRAAGHCFRSTSDTEVLLAGTWRQWTYWSLSDIEPQPLPDAEEAVAELLEGAVRLRLRSDVPVGVCLSGGLDSTAIICAMARNRGALTGGQAAPPLLAFCYHDAAFDERPFIADTLSQTSALLT